MSDQATYFITFTTYGARLPGDERGSVRRGRKGEPSFELPPSPEGVDRARALMAQPPFVLEAEQRASVAATIAEVCDFKQWTLHAINVRTNHAHLLVSSDVAPEVVMNTCKAWATRRLRQQGLVGPETRVWTRHGSTRPVRDENAFRRVAEYIIEGQGSDLGGLGVGPLE